MKIQKYEDLIVWDKGQNIAVDIYSILKENKDNSFKDQIQRAAVSISNNIAEGFDRNNPKEFRRFLLFSKGSCGEVKSMLYLAQKLEYIENKKTTSLRHNCDDVSKLLHGLIKTFENKINTLN